MQKEKGPPKGPSLRHGRTPYHSKYTQSFFFSPKPGAKIVLSIAKMITIATPPVAIVVTILRTASGIPNAAVTGFHMQVKRFITSMTPIVPSAWKPICGRIGPWLRKVTLRCSGKLMHSPRMIDV